MLCDTLRRTAINTWFLLGEAHTLGASMSEETLTELSLFEIQKSHPYEIATRWYSKAEENRSGADWEWWFLSTGEAVGFRIQAKKLDTLSQSYKALDKPQMRTLIKQASMSIPKRIPLYVFYNYFTGESRKYDYQYACEPRDMALLGCSVASAHMIRLSSRKLEKLAPIMFPWSCLVCCGDPSWSLSKRASNFVFREVEHMRRGDIDLSDYVVKEAPAYVYKLLQHKDLSEEDWDRVQARRIVVINDFKLRP